MTWLRLSLTKRVKVIFSLDKEGQVTIAHSAKRQSIQKSLILKSYLALKRRLAIITNVMFQDKPNFWWLRRYTCVFWETLFMWCNIASSGMGFFPNFSCNLQFLWCVCACACAPFNLPHWAYLKVTRYYYLSQH